MVKVITRNQSKVAVTRFFSRHDFCPHVIYLVYIETQNFGGWELKIDKMHRTEAHGTQHTRHSSSSSTAVAASPQRSMAAAGDAPYPGRRIPEIPPQWKYLTRYVLHKSLFSRKNECHFGRNWSNTHSWYKTGTMFPATEVSAKPILASFSAGGTHTVLVHVFFWLVLQHGATEKSWVLKTFFFPNPREDKTKNTVFFLNYFYKLNNHAFGFSDVNYHTEVTYTTGPER